MPSKPILKVSGLFLAVVSLIGFLDATFLTIKHYQGAVPPCSIIVGCEIVTTSQYSIVFHVPVALLGSLFYLVMLVLSVAYIDVRSEKLLRSAAYLSCVGFTATLWFLFVQAVLLHAFCIYCLGSTTTSTLLFIVGIAILAGSKKTFC